MSDIELMRRALTVLAAMGAPDPDLRTSLRVRIDAADRERDKQARDLLASKGYVWDGVSWSYALDAKPSKPAATIACDASGVPLQVCGYCGAKAGERHSNDCPEMNRFNRFRG